MLAVRPPTVPRDGSRLRVTLSSDHTDAEVNELIRVLKALRERARERRRDHFSSIVIFLIFVGLFGRSLRVCAGR